jgi:S-adenosyl methyltransferase
MDGVGPGSYMAMSHLTDDLQTDEIRALSASVPSSARYRFSARSRDEFSRFFDGLDLVDPGVARSTSGDPTSGRRLPRAASTSARSPASPDGRTGHASGNGATCGAVAAATRRAAATPK